MNTQIRRKWCNRRQWLLGTMLVAVLYTVGVSHGQTMLAGYRDFNYGNTVIATPTGEKPQSKLWFNDGIWWGSLWSPSANTYAIHRFDVANQTWIDTEVALDNRSKSKADMLWDGTFLYAVSNIFTNSPANTTSTNAGRLYKYSYNSTTKQYTLLPGFPVTVNNAKSETLVLDKDSFGRLWVTWAQGGKIWVNHTLADHSTWGTPYVIPVQGSDVDTDDISTLIAFKNKIGVLWSNQNDLKMYFAVHRDADPDQTWRARESGVADPNLGAVADDHINLKLSSDDDGVLYAATKTSLTGPDAPLIYIIKRDTSGTWSKYVFGLGINRHTRPILLLHRNERKMYVFAMSDRLGSESIYVKSTPLDNISFPSGLGDTFISSTTDLDIDDVTSTKQSVDSTSGILVIASDKYTHNYFHNYIPGGSATPPPPPPPPPPTEASIVLQGIQAGGSTNSAQVATSMAVQAQSGDLLLAAVAFRSVKSVLSISGLGLTWTRADAQLAGRSQTGIEVWKALASSAATGVITATLNSAAVSAVIAVSRYSGTDPAQPVGAVLSANTNGVDGAATGGTDNSSYNFNLTTSVAGAVVWNAATMRNRSHTPGSGYTEQREGSIGSGGDVTSMAIQDKTPATIGTLAVNGSFSGSVDWAVVAAELRPYTALAKKSAAADPPDSPELILAQNYPNPFNPATRIQYNLAKASRVRLAVYDIMGREVAIVWEGEQSAGSHQITWQARTQSGQPLASGIYWLTLDNGVFRSTRKMQLVR